MITIIVNRALPQKKSKVYQSHLCLYQACSGPLARMHFQTGLAVAGDLKRDCNDMSSKSAEDVAPRRAAARLRWLLRRMAQLEMKRWLCYIKSSLQNLIPKSIESMNIRGDSHGGKISPTVQQQGAGWREHPHARFARGLIRPSTHGSAVTLWEPLVKGSYA